MFDAIVLAGGTARRLGGADKPQLRVAGRSLLDRAVAAVAEAERIVVVGPVQPVEGAVAFCREDPPGGGPVAAVAAGLAATSADVVVVLAADLPWIAPAIRLLVDAVGGTSASGPAVLVDASGRPNHLAAAWPRSQLGAALDRVGELAGAAMRALVADVAPVYVQDSGRWGRDCDTWDDLAEARAGKDD